MDFISTFQSQELVYKPTSTSNPTSQSRELKSTSFTSTLNSTPHSQELLYVVYKSTLTSSFISNSEVVYRPTKLQIWPSTIIDKGSPAIGPFYAYITWQTVPSLLATTSVGSNSILIFQHLNYPLLLPPQAHKFFNSFHSSGLENLDVWINHRHNPILDSEFKGDHPCCDPPHAFYSGMVPLRYVYNNISWNSGCALTPGSQARDRVLAMLEHLWFEAEKWRIHQLLRERIRRLPNPIS
jgi:hypothetical protein